MKWLELRSAHFPDDIGQVVLYPLTEDSARGKMILTMNAEATRTRYAQTMMQLAATPAALFSIINVHDGFLPDEILFLEAPAVDQNSALAKVG